MTALTDTQLEHLCRIINGVRAGARLRGDALVPEAVAAQLDHELRPFSDHPVVATFLEDVHRATRQLPDFAATRDAATSDDGGLVLGMFAAPYNERLSLECLGFRREHIDPQVGTRYPHDGVRPVSVRCATDGFRFGLSVALFPENFVTSEPVDERHKAYYFIDRFVRRHHQITRPILNLCTDPASFRRVKAASSDELARAAIVWVHLHEYFHRLGFMPLPAFLKMKSSKITAGMEEVRCDILAAITVHRELLNGMPDGDLYAELILAERLIRYPLQDEPEANYDARGAQFLYGFLRERGVLGERDGRLTMPPSLRDVIDVLKEMAVGINKLEHDIVRQNDEHAKERRIELVKELGGFDPQSNTFRTLPFYERARAVAASARVSLAMEY